MLCSVKGINYQPFEGKINRAEYDHLHYPSGITRKDKTTTGITASRILAALINKHFST